MVSSLVPHPRVDVNILVPAVVGLYDGVIGPMLVLLIPRRRGRSCSPVMSSERRECLAHADAREHVEEARKKVPGILADAALARRQLPQRRLERCPEPLGHQVVQDRIQGRVEEVKDACNAREWQRKESQTRTLNELYTTIADLRIRDHFQFL